MKKISVGLLAIVLVLSISGCGVGDKKNDMMVEKHTLITEVAEKSNSKNYESENSVDEIGDTSSLEYVLSKMKAANKLCAVAYVGYYEKGDITDAMKVVSDSAFANTFTFVKDIDEDSMVVAGGCDIFCIIPEAGSKVVIYESELENDEIKATDVLYDGDDKPILLIANVSDILTNSIVSVTTADGKVLEFSPYISLKDGSLATTDDVLDFSIYTN